MKVRTMQIVDYNQVYQLWKDTPNMGLNAIDDSRLGIEKYLKRNPTTSFVVEEAGGIIGAALSGHDGRRGFIYHVAVCDSHQRKGVGKSLVDAIVKAMESEGITRIGLFIYNENYTGQAFWEANGFCKRSDIAYNTRDIVEFQQI